jgi:hypothetical protein
VDDIGARQRFEHFRGEMRRAAHAGEP